MLDSRGEGSVGGCLCGTTRRGRRSGGVGQRGRLPGGLQHEPGDTAHEPARLAAQVHEVGSAVDVIVVGAGLSGLSAAVDLVAAGRRVRVIEARGRAGGRIMSLAPEEGGRFDLGATWHWDDEPVVRALAAELGLTTFVQPAEGLALHEPDGGTPRPVELPATRAWRIAGGAERLCERLVERLPPGTVALGQRVTALATDDTLVEVTVSGHDGIRSSTAASAVVLAVPPRLVLQDVSFTPELPPGLVGAMEATPTWMGEALKCVAVYDSPFWRAPGWSGTAFSEIGPLSEVHDASEPGGPPALWGFVALDTYWRDMSPEVRVPAALEQLARLFGPEGADPVQYFERDWSSDPNTCEDEHRHGDVLDYGHPSFAGALWDGRLAWAGTETAAQGGGHMEGAVVAGRRAALLVTAAP